METWRSSREVGSAVAALLMRDMSNDVGCSFSCPKSRLYARRCSFWKCLGASLPWCRQGSGGYGTWCMNTLTSHPGRPLVRPSRSPTPDDTRAAQFVSEGYLVEKGLLGAAEIERLLHDILKLARGGYPSKSLKPVASNVPEEA